MAVTAGHAWTANTVADATKTDLLPTGSTCQEFTITCAAASAAPLIVYVRNAAWNRGGTGNTASSIHRWSASGTPTDSYTLALGETRTFAAMDPTNPIDKIMVAGSGGTATFSGTITAI